MTSQGPTDNLLLVARHGLELRRVLTRRLLWHTAGLLLVALIAWLALRGYQQPDFLLDFVNLRLC
jgi:hypothetical protein